MTSENEATTRPDNAAEEAAIAAKLPNYQERVHFKQLLVGNPNYFGTVKASPFPPVVSIADPTFYEQICSVGFQPQLNQFEAVVRVKQPYGYGGAVCAPGSYEHVRFFASYDNGATWHDLGADSIHVWDVAAGTAGARELEFVATRAFAPNRYWCRFPQVILVRAILSWNDMPTPGDPSYPPVWGNVVDVHVPVEPNRFPLIKDVAKQLELPAKFLELVDAEAPLPIPEPPELLTAQLMELYKGKEVEPHRLAFAQMKQILDAPGSTAMTLHANLASLVESFDVKLPDLLGKLFPVNIDGDTRYEELQCIGYDPDLDLLAGVIQIKLPSGYSGGPCTRGSREYVTFWADTDNNGSFETCLGTTSVAVYDMPVPKDGLMVAVFLPANLWKYRKLCTQGPVVMRIRGMLSWQSAPPCANPNQPPVWGNHKDALIHIAPGKPQQPGVHTPFIETVGDMDVENIDGLTGLANGASANRDPDELGGAGFTAVQSPFGGEVIITGRISDPPNISAGAAPLRYRVYVRPQGGTWQRLTNTFKVRRTQLTGGVFSAMPLFTQGSNPAYYEYVEDLDASDGTQYFVRGNLLARWQTAGLTGKHEIYMEVEDPITSGLWVSDVITIELDNTAPVPFVEITSGGGNCADFTIGVPVSGNYSATDAHFGSLTLDLLPAPSPAPAPPGGTFTAPTPLPRTYPTVPTTGESGTWTLNTTGLPRCGYVIELWVSDRTIVNSTYIGFTTRAVVGLCLREPGE